MLRRRINTITFLIFFSVVSIILFPLACLLWITTVLFDKRLIAQHLFTQFWGSLYFWTIPRWRVKFNGRKKISNQKACVLVANHRSLMDIVVLSGMFRHFKWVSRAEIFRVPFMGWNMTMNRYISLKRGDKKSIIKMMKDCEHAIKSGSSVLLFPEGTRSEDGELRRFLPGAFSLAKRMKVPIIPIVLNGTGEALPKNTFLLNGKCKITIDVLDEIPYESFSNKLPEEISVEIRNLFAQHVKEHQEVVKKKLIST